MGRSHTRAKHLVKRRNRARRHASPHIDTHDELPRTPPMLGWLLDTPSNHPDPAAWTPRQRQDNQ